MKLNAEEVRIPKKAREALLRHEKVVVLSHERPILAIVNIDDIQSDRSVGHFEKSFGVILNELRNIPFPDRDYFKELKDINEHQDLLPRDPWE